MAQRSCSIEIVKRNERRCIAFLTYAGNKFVNGQSRFDSLDTKTERGFRHVFDSWLADLHKNHQAHGFSGQYRKCFVFKRRSVGNNHRLYGFLAHINEAQQRQLCVVVHYAMKNQWETDQNILSSVESIRTDSNVVRAVERL